jgi:hypothetical protein
VNAWHGGARQLGNQKIERRKRMEKILIIKLPVQTKRVWQKDAVPAFVKMLAEFGFPSITEKEVERQIDQILEGKGKGIIASFLEDYIDIKETRRERNGCD